MEYEFAMLQLVESHLQTPVPHTLNFDSSDNNILGQAYMLQNRLPGQNLSSILKFLNPAQEKSLTLQATERHETG
jgi:hypothetical protein